MYINLSEKFAAKSEKIELQLGQDRLREGVFCMCFLKLSKIKERLKAKRNDAVAENLMMRRNAKKKAICRIKVLVKMDSRAHIELQTFNRNRDTSHRVTEKQNDVGKFRVTLTDQLWQDKNNCPLACIFMRYKVKSSVQNQSRERILII